jgi:hypothetical protein
MTQRATKIQTVNFIFWNEINNQTINSWKLANNNHRIDLKSNVGVRELFSITPSENIPSTAG